MKPRVQFLGWVDDEDKGEPRAEGQSSESDFGHWYMPDEGMSNIDTEDLNGSFFDTRFTDEQSTFRTPSSAEPTTAGDPDGASRAEGSGATWSPQADAWSASVDPSESAGVGSDTWSTSHPWVPWTAGWQDVPEHSSVQANLDQESVRWYDQDDGVFQQAVLHSFSPGCFLPFFPHPHQLKTHDGVT